MERKCLHCGSERIAKSDGSVMVFGHPNSFPTYRCSDCGAQSVWLTITTAEDAVLYIEDTPADHQDSGELEKTVDRLYGPKDDGDDDDDR